MSNATKLAHAVLRQLIEAGVSDFVVSPGSRNAPLLTALGEAAQKQIIDLHVKIDERGAAFYALGISKASNNYVYKRNRSCKFSSSCNRSFAQHN
jgi:2-succinyl-5-enolpyruvyl-6-hydroxy-3-cyclohexene-1-carboxylate synthase